MWFAITAAACFAGAVASGDNADEAGVICQEERGLRACRPAAVQEGDLWAIEIEPDDRCRTPAVVWQRRWFNTVRRAEQHQALLPVPLGGGGVHGLTIVCGRTSVVLPVAVAAAEFPVSELRVAPRFTRPPPPRAAEEARLMQRAMAGHRSGRTWTEAFVRPGEGRATSVFGVRRLFNGVLASQHRGLDIDGRTGTPVRAANDGVVVLVAEGFYFTGHAVILDHGERLFTTYYHLSRLDVRPDQRVQRGQTLGAIGRSGRVTGPHLHFGVKLEGVYVDPETLLRFDPTAPLGIPVTGR